MKKVKYNGKRGLRFHNIDFKPGETKEVSPELDFSDKLFEEVKEKKSSPKKKDE